MGDLILKYFMALFILITTVSDPWIDMFRSSGLAEATEVHVSIDRSSSENIVASELAFDHEHGNMPCSDDDCTDCHSCHLGHCGLLVPISLVVVRSEAAFLPIFYFEQVSSVSLDGLYRPPKTLI